MARAWELGALADPLAAALVAEVGGKAPQGAQPGWESQEVLAAQFADEGALAVMGVTGEGASTNEPVRQAVLLSPGGDSRPYRLPWPRFSSVFCVTCSQQQYLNEAGGRLWKDSRPRGCVLVPLSADFAKVQGLGDLLLSRGYRSNRESLWVLQGLQWAAGFDVENFFEAVQTAADHAALGSVLIAEVPLNPSEAEVWMASHGFLGRVVSLYDAGLKYGRPFEGPRAGSGFSLFVGRQTNRSLGERETYQAHLKAAEETDEDFFDNFS